MSRSLGCPQPRLPPVDRRRWDNAGSLMLGTTLGATCRLQCSAKLICATLIPLRLSHPPSEEHGDLHQQQDGQCDVGCEAAGQDGRAVTAKDQGVGDQTGDPRLRPSRGRRSEQTGKALRVAETGSRQQLRNEANRPRSDLRRPRRSVRFVMATPCVISIPCGDVPAGARSASRSAQRLAWFRRTGRWSHSPGGQVEGRANEEEGEPPGGASPSRAPHRANCNLTREPCLTPF